MDAKVLNSNCFKVLDGSKTDKLTRIDIIKNFITALQVSLGIVFMILLIFQIDFDTVNRALVLFSLSTLTSAIWGALLLIKC